VQGGKKKWVLRKVLSVEMDAECGMYGGEMIHGFGSGKHPDGKKTLSNSSHR